jgi:alpha-tubulin suppressor-like RCC1 family protein
LVVLGGLQLSGPEGASASTTTNAVSVRDASVPAPTTTKSSTAAVPSEIPVLAQALPTLPSGTWHALGPNPIGFEPSDCICTTTTRDFLQNGAYYGGHNSGRITALVAIGAGTHAGRVVAGTAGGGIWTSDDNGKSWSPRSDQAPSLAIGSIAEDPSSPDHLIAGMGEANATADGFYGFGILSSTDGGTTWSVQNPTYTSTNSTSYTATAATDSLAHWVTNQWAGTRVTQGSRFATVAGNTATTLTLAGGGWSGIPVNGTTFSIQVFEGTEIGGVAIDPSNSKKMFAATSNGLFVTSDGGISWTDQTYAAALGGSGIEVDSVVVDPANPNVVWIGARGSIPIAESTDGGVDWVATISCPSCTREGGKVLPPTYISTTNTTFAASSATDTSASWVANQWAGFTVTQGAASASVVSNTATKLVLTAPGWTPTKPTDGSVFTINTYPGAAVSLAMAPSSPSTLYASLGQGVGPVSLYKSTDSGSTWAQVTSAPDYTSHGYAYAGKSGGPWQGGYDNVVAVDPNDANHVLAGGEAVVETTDGGATWSNVNTKPFNSPGNNLLHPDQHALAFRPDGKIWIGNDGGVYFYDPSASGAKVTNANGSGGVGLNITQFYPGATGTDGFVLAGAQDNGLTELTPPVPHCQAIPNIPSSCIYEPPGYHPTWNSQGIGLYDSGATAVVDNQDPTCVASDCQFYLYTNAGGSGPAGLFISHDGLNTPADITPNPSNNKANRWPPIAAIANSSDPTNPIVFYGAQGLYRTANPTASPPTWTAVAGLYTSTTNTTYTMTSAADASATWTPNEWAGFTVTDGADSATVVSNNSNTLTLAGPGWTPNPPATSSVFGLKDTVSAIATSPTNAQVVYIGYDDGVVQASTDGGLTFTSLPVSPFRGFVSGISADPTNPQAITVSFATQMPTRSSFSAGNVAVAQFNSGTGLWTTITGNLALVDNNAQVSHVVYDNSAHLLAATDSGVYGAAAPNGASTVWSRVGMGLPNVQVVDLVVKLDTDTVYAVTHGRGVWLLSSNTAQAMGYAGYGGLGDGSFNGSTTPGCVGEACTPVVVRNAATKGVPAGTEPLRNVTSVASGFGHSMALLNNGTPVAWGLNDNGQLGNGTTANSDVPTIVCAVGTAPPCYANPLTSVSAIAAGDPIPDGVGSSFSNGFSLALTKAGTVAAWGDDIEGELGNGASGSAADTSIPVNVCAVGAASPCGPNILTGVTAIAAGGAHSLALLSNGTVVAWGDNAFGQLGNGTMSTTPVSTPVPVPGLQGVIAIAAGALHSLALLNNGQVMAWGDGSSGELGNGTLAASDVPVPVSLPVGATVAAVAAGRTDSFALRADGTVLAWGDNQYGELGDGTGGGFAFSDVPVSVCAVGTAAPCGTNVLNGVEAISAGGFSVLAVVSDPTNDAAVRGWGFNTNGELGDGNRNSALVPAIVCDGVAVVSNGGCSAGDELTGVTRIAAGLDQSVVADG